MIERIFGANDLKANHWHNILKVGGVEIYLSELGNAGWRMRARQVKGRRARIVFVSPDDRSTLSFKADISLATAEIRDIFVALQDGCMNTNGVKTLIVPRREKYLRDIPDGELLDELVSRIKPKSRKRSNRKNVIDITELLQTMCRGADGGFFAEPDTRATAGGLQSRL